MLVSGSHPRDVRTAVWASGFFGVRQAYPGAQPGLDNSRQTDRQAAGRAGTKTRCWVCGPVFSHRRARACPGPRPLSPVAHLACLPHSCSRGSRCPWAGLLVPLSHRRQRRLRRPSHRWRRLCRPEPGEVVRFCCGDGAKRVFQLPWQGEPVFLAKCSICLQSSDTCRWCPDFMSGCQSLGDGRGRNSCPVHEDSRVQGGILFARARGMACRCPGRDCRGVAWGSPGNRSKDRSSALGCPLFRMTGCVCVRQSGQEGGACLRSELIRFGTIMNRLSFRG